MIADAIRAQLQNIVRGEGVEGRKDTCSTVRSHLIASFGADPTLKSEFESRSIIKEKQAEFLIAYAEKTGLLLPSLPPESEYLTRGGESQIYLAPDWLNVIKTNDAVYYATWLEYFNSLVIHNLIFPDTAYSLLGFMKSDEQLTAVVKQPFVLGGQAKLADIKETLSFNGFTNTRRQDYYNEEFGLILEDMHDENVIEEDGILFFIDTVFYIMKK